MIICIIILLLFIIYCINNKYTRYYNGGSKLSIYTKIYKKCCDILKLNYVLKDNIITIKHNNKEIIFNKLYHNIKPLNSNLVFNKKNISNILRKNNISVPNNQIFNKEIKSIKYINYIIKTNKISFPLVVKPIDGTAALFVFTNIKNKFQLKNILIKYFLNKYISKSKTQCIMFEEHLYGKQYRIVCYKDIILDIIEITPPFIIGDGIHTIKELVDNINKIKQKNKKDLYVINNSFLKLNNFTKDTILEKNQKYILNIPKGRFGSIYKRININDVHIDNINMFKKINNYLGFEICGIDYIINDITLSYKTKKNIFSGINEVNKSPDLTPHCIGDGLEYSLQVPMRFLKLYFQIT